jgi:protein TonB
LKRIHSVLLIPLLTSFCVVHPALAVTRVPSQAEFKIVELARADTVLILRLDPEPIPRCFWDYTDSLRFTHCYEPLASIPAPDPDWSRDLGDLLARSEMGPWDPRCGYSPRVVVRFIEGDKTSDLVIFEASCDSARNGLLLITPGSPMEYRELKSGREDLEAMMEFAFAGELAVEEVIEVPPEGPSTAERVSDRPRDEHENDPATPEVILRVEPIYPEWARQAGIHGTVVLEVRVDPNGRMGNFRIAQGVKGLNDAAVEAMRQWRFRPARDQGKPVTSWLRFSLEFPPPQNQFPSPYEVTPYH